MMLTYHISHEIFFSTALYVHGRSGVKENPLTDKKPMMVHQWISYMMMFEKYTENTHSSFLYSL